VLCWITAAVVMPLVTLARLTRRCPALVREQSTVLSHDDLKLGSTARCGLAARLPYNEILSVDLDVKVLAIPTLPAEWEGLTVLHLSDLHFCGTPGREFFEKVAERCMDWRPDVVALTGDYVDDREQHAWLSPVFGKLHGRETSVAILGNHDYWYEPEEVRRQLADLGFRTPINAWEVVTVRGKPMVVIGHEGPWQRPAPDLSSCPPEAFRLCLSHTPDNIVWAREHRIDLMLSGHVHGGQIRFPLLGSVVVPSKYGRRYDCGTFQEGGTVLHVSRGLGGQHPLRFLCRPEATLLVLQRTAAPGVAT
jgi:predicted MPP superfamily phosphohydrolase